MGFEHILNSIFFIIIYFVDVCNDILESLCRTENRNFEAFIKLLSLNQIELSDLVTEEVDFSDSPDVYKKFDGGNKPLSILLRYEIKTDPKIDFEKVELDPEPNVGKVKVGIIGAGNFASTPERLDLIIAFSSSILG